MRSLTNTQFNRACALWLRAAGKYEECGLHLLHAIEREGVTNPIKDIMSSRSEDRSRLKNTRSKLALQVNSWERQRRFRAVIEKRIF